MQKNGSRLWAARATVVGLALTGATAFTTSLATSASAVVKNPNTLCAPHDGVAAVGKGFVECNDGMVFDV